MDRSEVKELLKTIDIYYPNSGVENPKLKLDAWEQILKKHDKAKVMQNFFDHVEESVFPPKIAELVRKPKEAAEPPRTVPDVQQTRSYLRSLDRPPQSTPEEIEQHLANIRNILGIRQAGESK